MPFVHDTPRHRDSRLRRRPAWGTDVSRDIVRHYDDHETSGKLDVLSELVRKLWSEGEKIVVWSNFVRTLEKIESTLSDLGRGWG